jgi:hypothetical protein
MSHRGVLRLPLAALPWLVAALSAQVAAAPLGNNTARPNDTDLGGADARVQGPYLAHRIKVDQNSLKLNNRKSGLFAPSHPSKP